MAMTVSLVDDQAKALFAALDVLLDYIEDRQGEIMERIIDRCHVDDREQIDAYLTGVKKQISDAFRARPKTS